MILADKIAKELWPWLQEEWPVTGDYLAAKLNDILAAHSGETVADMCGPSAIRGEMERHVEHLSERCDDLAARVTKIENQMNVFPQARSGA